ncbi:MAG: alpha/beta fold hydrolase [Pseudomonadota bacterium]
MRDIVSTDWLGTLGAGGKQLRLQFAFEAKDGGIEGVMVSLDQSPAPLALAEIQVSERRLSFAVPSARASFTGKLLAGAQGLMKIKGQWSQGPGKLPLSLEPTDSTLQSARCGVESPEAARLLSGEWISTLKAGEAKLPLVLKVEPCAGGVNAVVVSKQQSATITVTSLDISNAGNIEFALGSIGAAFVGRLEKDCIVGHWRQGGKSLPLEWHRNPSSRDQSSTTESTSTVTSGDPVTLPSGDGHISLAGTYSVPLGEVTAAVLLVAGSGPQDRNESIGQHRPFDNLAESLTKAGVSVLRYDKRGVGSSQGDYPSSGALDHLADVAAAMAWLRERHPTLPFGIVGHSLGGTFALLTALESSEVDFIVLLATPAIAGVPLMELQSSAIARAGGASEHVAERLASINRKLYEAAIVRYEDQAAALAALEQLVEEARLQTDALPEDALPRRDQLNGELKALLHPTFQFILQHDPAPLMQRLQIPVLALYGGKDTQVTPENHRAASAALAHLGDRAVVVLHADWNHRLQIANTGHPSEYAYAGDAIDPSALRHISDWIAQLLSNPPQPRRMAIHAAGAR